MMKKRFDCVAMKDAIQARLIRDMEGLSGVQRREAIRRDLNASQSPIGDIWRSLTEGRSKLAGVAEGRDAYGTDAGEGV